MKATLETPLTRLPRAGLVWLEGSAFTTVVTTPDRLIFEMRPPRTGSLRASEARGSCARSLGTLADRRAGAA